jgi:cob(I)alamin adenosyltransferase
MNSEFKIYTKTGDQGSTSLLGGTRVSKDHDRIEAYGTLDELNSFIGLLYDQDIPVRYKNILVRIQDCVFRAESFLAADKEEHTAALPRITEEDVRLLETEIDDMNIGLPPLHSFVLPGGHQAASLSHVARTVCRRAERITIRVSRTHYVEPVIVTYLNRLSDYFFMLARKLTYHFNAVETLWNKHNTK